MGLTLNAPNSTIKGLAIDSFAADGLLLNGVSGTVISGDYIGVTAAGNAAAGNGTGVYFQNGSHGNVVSGSVVSGNSASGVFITGAGTKANVIAGNKVGTDATGTFAIGNGSAGIYDTNSASNTTIGGTTSGARNIISGNDSDGVFIIGNPGTAVTGTVVEGNYIGTNATGSVALGNGDAGVYLWSTVSRNTVGGTTAAARNVISGNVADGVIMHDGASGNTVEGNFIGTDVTGMHALGNSDGVGIEGGASNNTVGGTAVGARNVISANTTYGVIIGSGTGSITGNVVEGNYVGTDSTGTVALGNGSYGVLILSSASNNIIGGTAAGARNVISANGYDGVFINGNVSAITGNVVEGDYIGTDATGEIALGNGRAGVYLWSAASRTTIGGTTAAARNVISANGADGVIIHNGASGNTVEGNYIGTDAAGSRALGNPYGVAIEGGSINNTVGGTTSGARNVISASSMDGVLIGGGSGAVTGTLVQGNYIGTDVTGSNSLGNSVGVVIANASTNNTIGGTSSGARNIISARQTKGSTSRTPAPPQTWWRGTTLAQTSPAHVRSPTSSAFGSNRARPITRSAERSPVQGTSSRATRPTASRSTMPAPLAT